MDVFTIEPDGDDIKITHSDNLHETMKAALGLDDLVLIPTGNGDEIVAPREQWNDGSNTYVLDPSFHCSLGATISSPLPVGINTRSSNPRAAFIVSCKLSE